MSLRTNFLAAGTVLALAGGVHADDAADCKNPQMQSALDICADKDAKAADGELTRIYRGLMSKYDDTNRKALQRTERAWIAYRDAECTYETLPNAGGTVYPMIASLCVTAKTKSRIKELVAQRDCQEGDLGCNAP